MKEQFVTGKNYDLDGGEIGRIIRILLCSKLIPLGNFGGGARLRGLLVLLLSHQTGGLIVLLEDKFHQLRLRLDDRLSDQ